ncbi:MAG TPA: 4-hydroxy-3-methylbut-2-enyl diphosphate reductase [Humidesulfovibrio sp.]|uniref:4-hydroxy-3-methylbut-2-enyl diphosphate reductase n=1 Tax=Humidesulfovibrio sp. TaxID=2910988 RepID=UPI002C964A91|nr:4-hydroxy-3-methylbut-2-enyl diphosphate reductase [Humidesulfovibrio sp.]HWR02456.1 4-hydroxy-3-methylbut-2-enyl diphosphate reductase [Humidesulfovibrio sp.]
MEVVRARLAGFCMGVGLALKKLDALLEDGDTRPTFMLGPIIHNPQVLEAYAKRGVGLTRNPDELPDGCRVIIRAHGIPRQHETALLSRGVEVVDATCPKVKRAQLLIGAEAEAGKSLLLFGEDDHPEVRGLLSYAGPDAFVFETREELARHELVPGREYFLAAQTTQDRQGFIQIQEELRERLPGGLPVLETVCDATRLRQGEAIRLAGECDCVIVAGGKASGNTRRLSQVIEEQGTPTVLVETVDDLTAGALLQYKRMGLTAGASTPKSIIDDIEAFLRAL